MLVIQVYRYNEEQDSTPYMQSMSVADEFRGGWCWMYWSICAKPISHLLTVAPAAKVFAARTA